MSAIKTADSVVSGLQSASKAVDDFAKNAKKLSDEGKDLNAVQDVFKDVEAFSKLSTAFGAIGVGLGIINSLFGEKSPEQQLLQKIDELINTVNSFWTAMDQQFAELNAHIDLEFAKQEIFKYYSRIGDAYDNLHLPQGNVTGTGPDKDEPGNDQTAFLKQSLKNNLVVKGMMSDVGKYSVNPAHDIVKLSCGEDEGANFFKAKYTATYGMYSDMYAVGHQMLLHILKARIVFGVLSGLAEGESNDVEVEKVNDQYASDFTTWQKAITRTTEYWANQCVVEAKQNIQNQMNHNILPGDNANFDKTAAELLSKLTANWPMFDFLVITYDSRGGTADGDFTQGLQWSKQAFDQHVCVYWDHKNKVSGKPFFNTIGEFGGYYNDFAEEVVPGKHLPQDEKGLVATFIPGKPGWGRDLYVAASNNNRIGPLMWLSPWMKTWNSSVPVPSGVYFK